MIDRLMGSPIRVPFRFRSEKWIEDLVQLLCRNSNTGIYHRSQEVTAVILLRLDRKFTWRVYALPGLYAIEHEIHQDLL